jgi:hypothetical protein
MTARAERGPQWDIGTQQYVVNCSFGSFFSELGFRFLVEEHSELYYDPTPLFEVVKKTKDEEFGVSEPAQTAHPLQQHPQHSHAGPSHHGQFNPMNSSQRHQTPMRDRDFHPQMGGQHMDPRHGHGAGPPMQASFPYGPNTPMRGPPGQGGGFPGGGGPGMGSGGGMQGQFFGGSPAPSPMRMGSMGGMGMDDGMGHPGMGGMGGMGGMQGVPGGPPGMGRRMTMGQDGFMPQ